MTHPAQLPELPDPGATPTRYYAVAYASSLVPTPERPFVVSSLAAGRELLWQISEGAERIDVREWVAGGVVESTTSFYGAQSDDAELVLYVDPPADCVDPHPAYTIRRGPRGGIVVTPQGPPRQFRQPRPTPPALAADRPIP